ncbi:MAG: Tetratricopeptide repeat [Clostridia bacterium]|nr:Tetratricopeptide repeat [Clostridia bacterium]
MQHENTQETKLNEALHYFDIQRYEQALDALYIVLSEAPNDGFALYLAAYCHYYLDNYKEAADYCVESMQQGFGMLECNYLLGRIYMDNDELVKAEQSYIEVLRNNPQHGPALAAYGMLMLKTGHEKKAKELMEEAMRVDPEDTVVLHYKFMYYLFKNKKSEQIIVLQRFINSTGNEVAKLINMGIYNMHNKNYKAARENYRQAFLLNPTDKNLLEILKELDRECNILYLPQRFINKVGPAVLWISFIALYFVLGLLKLYNIRMVVVMAYLILVLYSWVLVLGNAFVNLLKNIFKGKRQHE